MLASGLFHCVTLRYKYRNVVFINIIMFQECIAYVFPPFEGCFVQSSNIIIQQKTSDLVRPAIRRSEY